jgi:hypothetical protein
LYTSLHLSWRKKANKVFIGDDLLNNITTLRILAGSLNICGVESIKYTVKGVIAYNSVLVLVQMIIPPFFQVLPEKGYCLILLVREVIFYTAFHNNPRPEMYTGKLKGILEDAQKTK